MVTTRSHAAGVLLVLGLAAAACQNAEPAAEPAAEPSASDQETTFTLVLPEAEPAPEAVSEPQPAAQNAPADYRPEYHPATRHYVEQIEGGLKPLESIPSLPGHTDEAPAPVEVPDTDEGGETASVV